MKAMLIWEEILLILAEGRSITVLGRKCPEGNWTYGLVCDESTLAQLVDDILPEDAYNEALAESWDLLLEKMDKYPWVNLYPKIIHKEFRKKVMAAVLARTSDGWIIEKWENT